MERRVVAQHLSFPHTPENPLNLPYVKAGTLKELLSAVQGLNTGANGMTGGWKSQITPDSSAWVWTRAPTLRSPRSTFRFLRV